MSLSKVVRSSVRKIRSVLLLAVTISLLFYYTFENEIDMLNSYAENEYLPSINDATRIEGKMDTGGDPRSEPVLKDETASLDPSDLKALREKNKYFPLLISDLSHDPSKLLETSNDLDPSSFSTHKEKYPVLNEVSLPPTLLTNPISCLSVQNSHFEDGGTQNDELISLVRQIFVKSWSQELLLEGINQYHWPLSLIDALDSLYIMGQSEKFDRAVAAISKIDFTAPPTSVEIIDIPDLSTRVLGGLISAYDLSQNPVLIDKAKDVADFLLRSFDTPNRIPLLSYFWRSRLDNKFPYQKANAGLLTSMTLELIRLSQITKIDKYFDAVQRVYNTISLSLDEFDLEHLFPTHVDASGCVLISPDEIKVGKHLSDPKGMKSIDENLQFVQCHQTDKLITSPPDRSKKEQTFDMNAPVHSLYSNLVKAFQLLNCNDLLKFTDSYRVKDDGDIKHYVRDGKGTKKVTNKKEDKVTEEHIHTSKQIFIKAMQSVRDLMTYSPSTPLGEHLTMISSLKTKAQMSPATNEINVEITKLYDMRFERCTLASTLSLGSRLFGMPEYLEFASNLTASCFQLSKLFQGLQPDELFLDPCENDGCLFEAEKKIERVNDGNFYGSAHSKQDEITKEGVEIAQAGEHEVRPQRVLAFALSHGPSFHQLGDLEIDATSKTWKDESKRPLWVNKMGRLSLLSPDVIEGIFYLYRITGEAKWREMGQEMFEMTLSNLQALNSGAKGVWRIPEMQKEGNGMASSIWLSRTLKLYYLLFSYKDYYSLDDYVFTSGGHLMKRNAAGGNPK